MSKSLLERIAELALGIFEKLPQKCKPRNLPNGRNEWTPMSAIVLHRADNDEQDGNLNCVALATGTKCLPASTLPKCKGAVLHDCHAEVLALRGFNYWTLAEIEKILSEGSESAFLEFSDQMRHGRISDGNPAPQNLFTFRSGISIYLFSTEAPCGDASMEILMSSKPGEENIPWSQDALAADLATGQPLGRGHFSLLGAVRRKPARSDAEASMSKSCTDKLALKQFTSLLAFPTDLFVQATPEAFLKAMVVYDEQFHSEGFHRAFAQDGRLAACDSTAAHFFETQSLPHDFPRFLYEKKRAVTIKQKPTNISAVWICGRGCGPPIVEVLVNGVKQGFRQLDDREGKRSVLCRQNMVSKAFIISQHLAAGTSGHFLPTNKPLTYENAKGGRSREWKTRKKWEVIAALGGWPSKAHDDSFEVSPESWHLERSTST